MIAEEKYQGQFRDKEVGIYDQQGQLVFQGCKAINVETVKMLPMALRLKLDFSFYPPKSSSSV